MFVHETHLPQILKPLHYTSAEQLEREKEHLLLPAWHLAGSLSDFPNDGDFITCELLGRPIILWRSGETVQAFLNVCPHRFARLSGKPCGHAGERLQCQYHGWEFDICGQTRKIPDAPSFRPMTKGHFGLQKLETELCGQLIFVNLSESPCSLREFLGPGYELGERLCGEHRLQAVTFDWEIDCNWKIKIENSLESYHLEMVHVSTIARIPDPEICRHELQPRWTTFATTLTARPGLESFLDRLQYKFAKVEPDPEYKQYHYYPHIMFGKMRLFSWVEMIVPLSPTRCRVYNKVFSYKSTSGKLKSRIFCRMLAKWGKKYFTTLGLEDANIVQEVQKGLDSDMHASGGLVSIREERCHHFQEYVHQSTAEETFLDRSDQAVPSATSN